MKGNAPKYRLFYYPNNASLAPHFLLHHMQLDYELVLVDKKGKGQKSQAYLKLNPAGRIPTLIADGLPIFESSAICIHLCESHPEHQLIPRLGSPLRPQFFQWMAYLNNTLQAELMIRYYPQRHTTEELACDSIRAAQEERIADVLSIIDAQLKGKQYLLGDTLTACDYFLFMLAGWSMPMKTSPMSFDSLSDYLDRLSHLSTIEAVCGIEDIDLEAFREPAI